MISLPRSLVRFERELADAIERDLGSQRPRTVRRRTLRVSLVGVAAAGVALGALSLVPGQGPSVVARAAAALRVSGGTILHIDMIGHSVGMDGTSSNWREESWQEASAPFAHRSVRTASGVAVDVVTRSDGSSDLYDPTSNTIYAVTGAPPPPEVKPRPAPGETPWPVGKPSLSAAPQPASQNVDILRGMVLKILESGGVSPAGHVTVEGRDALKLASADGTVAILVDPQTYDPIAWTLTGPDGAEMTLHFDVYEQVPASASNASLFDLRAQHTSASIDTNPADYTAAFTRLEADG